MRCNGFLGVALNVNFIFVFVYNILKVMFKVKPDSRLPLSSFL